MNTITIAVILLGAAGGLAGIVLAVSSRLFAVKVDPRIMEIEKILPGANCGGCGNPSCFTYAQSIVEEGSEPNLCVLDPGAAAQIGGVLGVEVSGREKQVAAVRCYGGSSSQKKFEYDGLPSCRTAQMFSQGDSRCPYSCLGFGDCVAVCPFDALHRDGRNTPVVDREKCTGCGQCVAECPKNLIIRVPISARPHIACNTCEKGKVVRQICPIGCITCGMCVKVCPEDAIALEDNRPHIDYGKCTSCGACIEKCPRNIIVELVPAEKIEETGS